ncbi:bifunctional oligoribonuclease/PAP phosphatase NrnA [Mammaliicoccus sciuri]|nr:MULTISPECIES: bifunctional oligoribonuclease/PAP phosphatase NrnA [Sporosarcina]MBY0222358.1 bifunctional oligoribonuclease/PAP phosphatase NrnA [Sporosarcina aquimarina]SKA91855.1 phosphoesterase RecJ domain-containing protein [Sporosarcina newyorkensis]
MKRQIIDTIERYQKIIIHRHVRPDPDAYGSQMGLKELIKKNYPDKEVLAAGTHDELLTYLGKPDQVTEADYEGALVIVTDTANTDRIDGEFFKQGSFLLKIDHHPNEDPYGDERWVNTEASSCSEMIYTLFEEGQASYGWEISTEAARFLFAGIVGDTGRFMFQSTTEKTFEIASSLIKQPFDRTKLFAGMYEVERKILHLQGYIYQNFTIDEHGAAYIKLTREILDQFDVTVSETSQLVGSLGNVEGICAWIIFVEEDDQIRVRLRSKGPVINTLAMQYNGGGHPLASGASVYSWDEANEVIVKLAEICRNY